MAAQSKNCTIQNNIQQAMVESIRERLDWPRMVFSWNGKKDLKSKGC